MLPILAGSDTAIAIRSAMALVFLGAAVGKMRHITIFQGVVANYRLLPRKLILPVAYGMPPAEAIIGAALLTGHCSPWAEIAAAALLLIFALAMGVNLRRGRRHIDCGCFQGALKQELRWSLVVRNCVMALLMAAASAPVAADLWTQVNGMMAGIALFLVVQCLNVLWAIVPRGSPDIRPRRAQTEGM